MKRDMDLIRQLLLRIEAQRLGVGGSVDQVLMLSASKPPLCLDGEDPDEVHYKMRLLAEGGYLGMTKTQFAGGFNILGLTWEGHDFLDSVRDNEVWRKTKDGALKAGGFTFDLLKDLAKGLLKKQIEERTGMKL
jgi:hypothetical protein